MFIHIFKTALRYYFVTKSYLLDLNFSYCFIDIFNLAFTNINTGENFSLIKVAVVEMNNIRSRALKKL